MVRHVDRSTLIAWAAVAAVIAGGGVPALAQFAEEDVRVLQTFVAENEGDSFGFVAERLGDLDGDGAPELIIGAPAFPGDGSAAGRAYVYSGSSGELLNTLTGDDNDQLGFAVGDAGDLNDDGVSDYVVGGPGTFSSPVPFRGRVLVVSGADHQVLHELVGGGAFRGFGYEALGIRDVDGDGVGDLAVGAPFTSSNEFLNNGRVHVFSGASGAELWSADGLYVGGFLGVGVSGSSADLDGDGVPEVAAGALGAGPRGTGAVTFFSGATGAALRYALPEDTAGSLGWFFVDDAGDVDGDGVGDLFVGDFGDTGLGPGSGRAYVFSGLVHSTVRTSDDRAPAPEFELARAALTIPARTPGEGLGIGRGAGDLDGDGLADIVVAGYTNGEAAEQGGRVYLVRGHDGQVLRTLTGTEPFAQLGFDALMAGDADGDGIRDILITGVDVAYLVAGTPVD